MHGEKMFEWGFSNQRVIRAYPCESVSKGTSPPDNQTDIKTQKAASLWKCLSFLCKLISPWVRWDEWTDTLSQILPHPSAKSRSNTEMLQTTGLTFLSELDVGLSPAVTVLHITGVVSQITLLHRVDSKRDGNFLLPQVFPDCPAGGSTEHR